MVGGMSGRRPEGGAWVPVDRDEVDVMFFRSPDDPAVFGPLWTRLEELVGLRGRKFYGAFTPSTKEYHVSVQRQDGDDPAALGLETGTLPGGRYLRARLHGEPPQVYERIGPTFEALAAAAHSDESRPSIEFYRQRDQIDLFLPITQDI
jgi:hypothetical protein